MSTLLQFVTDDTNPLLAAPMASGLRVPSGSLQLTGVLNTYAGGLETASVTSTTLTAAVNYTGKGVLEFACVQSGSSSSAQKRLKITIDGNVAFDANASALTNSALAAVGVLGGNSVGLGAVPFKSSLLIEYASVTTAELTYCHYKYRRTA